MIATGDTLALTGHASPDGDNGPRSVKAVFYEGHGRFALRDSKPRSPADGEVRLDVAYCGVCGTDLHIAHGAMDQRVSVPQVIGHEMSGNRG